MEIEATNGLEAVYKRDFPWNNDRPRSLWSLADMLKAFHVSDFDKLLSDSEDSKRTSTIA